MLVGDGAYRQCKVLSLPKMTGWPWCSLPIGSFRRQVPWWVCQPSWAAPASVPCSSQVAVSRWHCPRTTSAASQSSARHSPAVVASPSSSSSPLPDPPEPHSTCNSPTHSVLASVQPSIHGNNHTFLSNYLKCYLMTTVVPTTSGLGKGWLVGWCLMALSAQKCYIVPCE